MTCVFPSALLTVVTGVSGSGKSTLVNDILYRALAQKIYRSMETARRVSAPSRASEHLDKVIEIDQTPIGRTPRSNPATYTGVFGPIRELFAMLPESRERGYKPGTVQLQRQGRPLRSLPGRRPAAHRNELSCPTFTSPAKFAAAAATTPKRWPCAYKGYSISDLLDLPIEEALPVLENIPQINQKLKTLVDVGLGYVKLGPIGDHAFRRRGATHQAGPRTFPPADRPHSLHSR